MMLSSLCRYWVVIPIQLREQFLQLTQIINALSVNVHCYMVRLVLRSALWLCLLRFRLRCSRLLFLCLFLGLGNSILLLSRIRLFLSAREEPW